MKPFSRLGVSSVVALALIAGVFTIAGCDSGPSEGSLPPLKGDKGGVTGKMPAPQKAKGKIGVSAGTEAAK